jgi:DNA-binding LacI/PurR family transcriptional regulator
MWVVTAFPAKKVAALVRSAAELALGRHSPPVVTHIPIQPASTYSRVTFSAYTGMREKMASGYPEAIVIHGDFETQGVLDALAENTRAELHPPRIVAMVNKASQIHSRFSYAALVADGHAVGEAAAELLQEHIANPQQAPAFVRLSSWVRGDSGGLPVPEVMNERTNGLEKRRMTKSEALR